MTYRVIKTIGGKQYYYDQESYREGGKVRTRSTYVGPVRESNDGFVARVLRRKKKEEQSFGEDVEQAMVMVARLTGRSVEQQLAEMDAEYAGRDGRVPTLSFQNELPAEVAPAPAEATAEVVSATIGDETAAESDAAVGESGDGDGESE